MKSLAIYSEITDCAQAGQARLLSLPRVVQQTRVSRDEDVKYHTGISAMLHKWHLIVKNE